MGGQSVADGHDVEKMTHDERPSKGDNAYWTTIRGTATIALLAALACVIAGCATRDDVPSSTPDDVPSSTRDDGPAWSPSAPPKLTVLRLTRHVIDLSGEPPFTGGTVTRIENAGDVNGDGLDDLDVVWRLDSPPGGRAWRHLVFYGRRLADVRGAASALAAGAASAYDVNQAPATLRTRVATTGDFLGLGSAQTATTTDDFMEKRFSCADSPGCVHIYSASKLALTDGGGKEVYAYGEDWGSDQNAIGLDLPLASTQSVRGFGLSGQPGLLLSTPTGGVRVIVWKRGEPAQVPLELRAYDFDRYQVNAPAPLAIDLNGDGVDEIVGMSPRTLAIVILNRQPSR